MFIVTGHGGSVLRVKSLRAFVGPMAFPVAPVANVGYWAFRAHARSQNSMAGRKHLAYDTLDKGFCAGAGMLGLPAVHRDR